MLSECRDSDRGTLDNIRMWWVNPRSESRVCCEPFHGDMFDEGVFAFDLCPLGGTHSTVGFPQEYTPVRCRDFAMEFDPELINRPSDLVNQCRLLCVLTGDA